MQTTVSGSHDSPREYLLLSSSYFHSTVSGWAEAIKDCYAGTTEAPKHEGIEEFGIFEQPEAVLLSSALRTSGMNEEIRGWGWSAPQPLQRDNPTPEQTDNRAEYALQLPTGSDPIGERVPEPDRNP